MKRPVIGDGESLAAPHACSDGLLEECPLLARAMVESCYHGSNDKRMPGTLFIYLSAGRWNAILKDPTSGMRLRVQTDTWPALIHGLECLLGSDKCPWEADPAGPVEPARKGSRRS